MAKFFGTNGIRGVFAEDFTLEFVHDMTLAIGTYFERGPVLIALSSFPVIPQFFGFLIQLFCR